MSHVSHMNLKTIQSSESSMLGNHSMLLGGCG